MPISDFLSYSLSQKYSNTDMPSWPGGTTNPCRNPLGTHSWFCFSESSSNTSDTPNVSESGRASVITSNIFPHTAYTNLPWHDFPDYACMPRATQDLDLLLLICLIHDKSEYQLSVYSIPTSCFSTSVKLPRLSEYTSGTRSNTRDLGILESCQNYS